ncbi:MAG: MBL fold metallo-hydrolase [Opitutales bacterium]
MKDPRYRIEDNFEDVLGKAMSGLGLRLGEVASRAGMSAEACEALLSGQLDASALRAVAGVLNLNADCLLRLATEPVVPSVKLPEGIAWHNTPFPIPGYEEMTVNSYSLVPPGQGEAGCLIDAGAAFATIREDRAGAMASEWTLLLTHTHVDHVVAYKELSGIAVGAYSPSGEAYQGAISFSEGESFKIGPWRLQALSTPGHSPDGMSYLLEGVGTPVLFVGDALFCYSVGKIREHYRDSLASIREKILRLPDATIVCPGHGPLTTVAFEKAHNPFFAESPNMV